MHHILNAMVRLMSPILPFTSEEIWKYMPEHGDTAQSVHELSLPEARQEWQNDPLSQKWKVLLEVRGEVTKALEEARARKLIGHPLDAAVTLFAEKDVYEILEPYAQDLRFIFIVSQADLTQVPLGEQAFQSEVVEGLSIDVTPSPGEKCERCWTHSVSVGTNDAHATLCDRCIGVMEQMDQN